MEERMMTLFYTIGLWLLIIAGGIMAGLGITVGWLLIAVGVAMGAIRARRTFRERMSMGETDEQD
jgi:hypothetical protein